MLFRLPRVGPVVFSGQVPRGRADPPGRVTVALGGGAPAPDFRVVAVQARPDLGVLADLLLMFEIWLMESGRAGDELVGFWDSEVNDMNISAERSVLYFCLIGLRLGVIGSGPDSAFMRPAETVSRGFGARSTRVRGRGPVAAAGRGLACLARGGSP